MANLIQTISAKAKKAVEDEFNRIKAPNLTALSVPTDKLVQDTGAVAEQIFGGILNKYKTDKNTYQVKNSALDAVNSLLYPKLQEFQKKPFVDTTYKPFDLSSFQNNASQTSQKLQTSITNLTDTFQKGLSQGVDYLKLRQVPKLFDRAPGTFGPLDPGSYYGQFNKAYQDFQKRTGRSGSDFFRSKEFMDMSANTAFMMSAGPKEVPEGSIPKLPDFEAEMNALKEMGQGKSPLNGLLNESPAQTAARRLAGLEPKDVYKLPEPIDQAITELTDFTKNTSVKDKINIFDYLRTPDRVLQKIGLGKQAVELQTAWDGYLKELPVEIDKVSQWADRVKGDPGANQTIFKYLDGQITKDSLKPIELEVASEIKDYFAKFADRLGLPKDQRITSYITHIWEKDTLGKEFPDEIAKLIRDKVAGSVYDPFVEKRLGLSGYKEDTWAALDAYIKRGLRKANLDPVLDKVKLAANSLEDSQYNYVKRYIDRVNLRPTEVDNLLDNTFKNLFGYKAGQRPIAAITSTARRMVYRGLLGLNPGAALKNLSQGANTYAELGEKYTALGYLKVAQNFPKFVTGAETELETSGVLRDGFVQDRALSSTKKLLKNTDEGLFYLFNLAEKINRGAAYFGAKAKALAIGKTEEEAVNFAKDVVRKTQFTFGNIDTPVALQSDIVKTLTQFMSYSFKQAEFLGEKIKDKQWTGIIRYIGANLVFMITLGRLIGFKPEDMIPQFRFGTPPTLQLPVSIGEAIAGTPDKYGNVPDIPKRLENIGNAALPFIPAGAQIKKTFNGLNDVEQGSSQTPTGKIRYDIQQTPENYIRGALFGPYNLDEAQNYYKGTTTSSASSVKSASAKDLPSYANGQPYVQSSDSPQGINRIPLYAQAVFTDPIATLNAVLQGNPVRKIAGNAVILERANGLSGIDQGDITTQVDHTIALSLGGKNPPMSQVQDYLTGKRKQLPDNIEILTAQDNKLKGQVETYLAKELQAGRITKAEAQKRDLNWRNEIKNINPNANGADFAATYVEDSKLQTLQTYFGVDQVLSKTPTNAFEEAMKQEEVFNKIDRILASDKVTEAQKYQLLNSLGVNHDQADYYKLSKESTAVRLGYIEDYMNENPSGSLVPFLVEVGGKKVLTSPIITALVSDGRLSKSAAALLRNTKIAADGKVSSSGSSVKSGKSVKSGRKKTKLPKLTKVKVPKVKIPNIGNLAKLKPVHLQPSQFKINANQLLKGLK